MIARLEIEPRIRNDLKILDVELCIHRYGGYWASLRVESNLMLRIKDSQKDDGELWSIVQNIEDGKPSEFRVDDSGIIWFGDRLCGSFDRGSCWYENGILGRGVLQIRGVVLIGVTLFEGGIWSYLFSGSSA
ncbi:reverse transcriptase domain-containing protein [Artemisia annua]|uniref:Reverse transcriptase domain-containing protein n=1 Tax=Artemisia annua TaxID=35608 RepID=A0A2U1MDA4_ARTAN|nr:reverse transcriptase domain-containing protein [Artemisia annua]